jgi:hypothetical protein
MNYYAHTRMRTQPHDCYPFPNRFPAFPGKQSKIRDSDRFPVSLPIQGNGTGNGLGPSQTSNPTAKRFPAVHGRMQGMNRRQRRAQGHRGATAQMHKAIHCPDCNSDVTLTKVANGYQATIEHDATCPWYAALHRAGGLGVRLLPLGGPDNNGEK